jgi:hypothetical protein
LSGTQTVAPGGTTTISSDGTAGGEWTSSDDAVATVDISTGVVTGVFGGTADITYTVGGTACPDAATITITVACASDIVVTYDDVEHCEGNTSTLSGTIDDGNISLETLTFNGSDSYGDGWSGSTVDVLVDGVIVVDDFTVGAVGANVVESTTFSAAPGGVITLTWTTGSWTGEVGWNITASDGSYVNPQGAAGAHGNGQGGTVPGALPTYTYAWTPSTDLDDASIASPVASNTATTTYTLLVTSSDGCTGTDDVIATVSNPTAGTLSS